jgi:predicted nucleic acid-binding protein
VKVFFDTNTLIYWVDAGARADTVERLLSGDSVISVQVLNEFANVLMKKRKLSITAVRELSNTLIDTCEVYDLSVRTHQAAWALMERYHFSLYDAHIVASAGLSGCAVLYSEDMQDGLNVKMPPIAGDSTLSIRNPFR